MSEFISNIKDDLQSVIANVAMIDVSKGDDIDKESKMEAIGYLSKIIKDIDAVMEMEEQK